MKRILAFVRRNVPSGCDARHGSERFGVPNDEPVEELGDDPTLGLPCHERRVQGFHFRLVDEREVRRRHAPQRQSPECASSKKCAQKKAENATWAQWKSASGRARIIGGALRHICLWAS